MLSQHDGLRRFAARGAALVAAALAGALAAPPGSGAGCPEPGPAPLLPAAEVDAAVLLVGDTGQPGRQSEAVLAALAGELRALGATLGGSRIRIVFLGDNLYPVGLPPAGESGHDRLRPRLDRQLEVLEGPPEGLQGIFVPGNHDWDRGGPDGLAHVRAQGLYLDAHGGGRARLLPAGGCPGPEVVDVGARLRLLLLDSQWWLHPWEKPEEPRSPCPADSEAEVLGALAAAIDRAGPRRVVVAAHHPIVSGGPHGLHWAGRRWAGHPQDLGAPRYRRWGEALSEVLRRHPPLLYAAGHDHTLQLIRPPDLPLLAVSGAGSKLDPVAPVEGTLFCRSAPGFLRLEVAGDGRARLAAVVVAAETGAAREVAALLLPP